MGDLRFGATGRAIVLGGEDLFRSVGPPGADRRVHVHGSLIGLDDEALLRSDSFVDLFGRFVVLVHRVRDDVLEVHNDRWGSLPLFYALSGRVVYLSHRLKAIGEAVGGTPQIDLTALGEVMAFDFPLRDRTLIAGIHSLEGGMRLDIDLRGIGAPRPKRIWNPLTAMRQGRASFAERRDGLLSAFLEGCERSTADADQVGITLSGGMDSRCLLAAAVGLGKSVRSYHMSDPGGRADVYARRLAELCGVSHLAPAIGAEFGTQYYRRLRSLIALHEGMSFEPETEVCWLRDQVSDAGVMLHGGYAELSKLGDLRRFYLDARLRRRRATRLGPALWRRFERPFEIRLRAFTADLRAELMERTRTSFVERIRSLAECDGEVTNEELVQLCYLHEQVKIEKHSGCMWNDHVRTRFPFSYPRYVDLLLGVPAADRIQQTFQIYALQKMRPALYDVPDANTGLRAGAPPLMRLLVRAAAKLRAKLGNRVPAEHADVVGWIRFVDPPIGEALVQDADERLYDRAALSRLANDMAHDRRVGEVFQSILMLELWREYMGLRGPLAC